ncbi:shieldin complex subunit 3 isoform X3 [Amphiprion ocellaris]|uniref:shieldin complex subunit 3 isoform X3 n=1 Tax=Amphiprion ocellaris TaxID=80972 RepID=UPI0024118AF2|nr:shieldin complex subunit 3 isoform X3 [Amphiprion ocellaris]
MEDVVLHYRSGSAEGLQTLLETSEKLLELFPCRPPPVFTCWFPAAADRLPIRPVKPAPVITSSDASISKPLLGNQSESRTADGVSEEQTSPVRRSWSVFRQTEVLLQSSQSMSRRFLHMVSLHKLHLRQRAKWVIREKNWETRDIEQVWRTLTVVLVPAGLEDSNRLVLVPAGLEDSNRLVLVPAGLEDSNRLVLVPAGLEDSNRLVLVPAGLEDSNRLVLVPAGLEDSNRLVLVPAGLEDSNRLVLVPAGLEDSDPVCPELRSAVV